MANEQPSPNSTRSQPWLRWIIAAAALGLALLALGVGSLGLAGIGSAADRSMAPLNLLTGLTGLAGVVGYWLGKRWGIYNYGVSMLGHVIAHVMLGVSALAQGRASLMSGVGLAVIPGVAAVVFIVMVWEIRRRV